MAGKTDFWSNRILGLLTDDTAASALATQYVALFTSAPTDAGGGTEVAGGTYARKAITAAEWSAIGAGSPGREISNGIVLTWASWDSGSANISAFGLFDQLTTGNLIYWADLDTPRTVENGETASFDTGALVINED